MNSEKYIASIIVSIIFIQFAFAQKIETPFVGSKTHPTMRIDSIVLKEARTCFYLSIVNERSEDNAWFCADKNIALYELNSGVVHQLISTEGIPTCPEIHQFSYKGEELSFTLFFPELVDKKGELDLIEHCPDHCFSLSQIVLDTDLNTELRVFEEGIKLFQDQQYLPALKLFQELSQSSYQSENHFAYTLYILPVIYLKLGDAKKARQSYLILKESTIYQKQYFIKKIHEIPFFREME